MEQQHNDKETTNPMEAYQRELDRADEAKHEAATTMAEKICDMLGVEGVEERAKMVEGYRAIFGGGPRYPIDPMTMPVQMTQPDPCCTTTDADGNIVTIDLFCLLSHTFKQVFNPNEGTCILHVYNRPIPIQLNKEQTKYCLQYISKLKDFPGSRVPLDLLKHPAVQKLLDEELHYTSEGKGHDCYVRQYSDRWEVGQMDDDNVEHVTTFTGPDAEREAKQFADSL